MNKLKLIALMFLFVVACSFSEADQITIKFAWHQDLPVPNDLTGWNLYKSITPGGPYSPQVGFLFSVASPTNEYEATTAISFPAGQVTTYYFVLTATDKEGNESGYSNEVSYKRDFQAPNVPQNLRIQ